MTARWKTNGKMYRATVTDASNEESLAVQFDDGDVDPAVPREHVVARDLAVFDVCVMHRYALQTVCVRVYW